MGFAPLHRKETRGRQKEKKTHTARLPENHLDCMPEFQGIIEVIFRLQLWGDLLT
jgi:hypothetical protein